MTGAPINRSRVFSRRESLLLGGAVILAASPLFLSGATGQAGAWQRLDEIRNLIGEETPRTSGIDIELPLVSEDGSAVPLTVRVDGPMNDTDHVESLHLFAPGNPTPKLAAFHFTPLAGRAEIHTRVRLNESQTVIAVARLRSGEIRLAERDVRVTITGCLMRDDTYPEEDLMRTRIRVPQSFTAGEPAEVLTIINHPMETGLRTDASGETLEKRIIERFEARINGEPALVADLHRSVSANPYLRFYIAPRDGGELTLEWTEDTGETVTETARIEVG